MGEDPDGERVLLSFNLAVITSFCFPRGDQEQVPQKPGNAASEAHEGDEPFLEF